MLDSTIKSAKWEASYFEFSAATTRLCATCIQALTDCRNWRRTTNLDGQICWTKSHATFESLEKRREECEICSRYWGCCSQVVQQALANGELDSGATRLEVAGDRVTVSNIHEENHAISFQLFRLGIALACGPSGTQILTDEQTAKSSTNWEAPRLQVTRL